MSHLSVIDWCVCFAYLSIVCSLAIVSMRGQRDNEDYFVGGRQMNWLAVGISMFATSFSSISFLGLPQRGAYQDFSFYLTILLILLVITPLLWFIFVPVYIRLQVSSGYAYLGLRFNSTVQRVGSLLYCGYALGWMGAMLYAIAVTLKGVMSLSESQYLAMLIGLGLFATAYTAVGGLRAVIWTDVLQAGTMCFAVAVAVMLAIGRINGGWESLWQLGKDHDRWTIWRLEGNLLSPASLTASNSIVTALAICLFMYLPGYAVTQNMIQRYVCTGSLSKARGVVLLSGVINAVLGFLFMFVGVTIFVFYMQPSGPGMPVLETEDQILPYFVATEAAGSGLMGLLLAGLLAAAMSTMDSGINGVASVIVYDWLAGRDLSLRASRTLTAVLGGLVIAAALVAPRLGENVIDIIMVIAGTLLGALMAVFLLGLFASRTNGPGVLIGLSAGIISVLAVIRYSDVPRWWFGAFAIAPTLVVGMVASCFFPAPRAECLAGTVWQMRKNVGQSRGRDTT